MQRIEGQLSRFFFNPVTGSAMFRLRGSEHVHYVTVPKHISDCDFFAMTRPGDVVAITLEEEDVVEGWFNETYVMDLT
jgi:hypothetical protein